MEKVPNNVLNPTLYLKIKQKVKKQVKVWPSAYGSGLLVQEYKKAGGKYRGDKRISKNKGLDRWYEEKWVNVCKPKSGGGWEQCGRKQSSLKEYPYCRPSVRITSSTPTTAPELIKKWGSNKLKELCKVKRAKGLPKGKKSKRITPKETRKTSLKKRR